MQGFYIKLALFLALAPLVSFFFQHKYADYQQFMKVGLVFEGALPTGELKILDWSFNKDRNLLITATGESAKIWLFDEVTVQLDLLAELKGHDLAVLAIAISEHSDFLVTVSEDKKAVVWPIAPVSLLKSRNLQE